MWLVGACNSMDYYNMRKDEKGWPVIEDCLKHIFFMYYVSPEVSSSFDRFYRNVDNIQDRFIDYWVVVAKFFNNN